MKTLGGSICTVSPASDVSCRSKCVWPCPFCLVLVFVVVCFNKNTSTVSEAHPISKWLHLSQPICNGCLQAKLRLSPISVKDTTQPTEGLKVEFLVLIKLLWCRRGVALESGFCFFVCFLVKNPGGWGNAWFIWGTVGYMNGGLHSLQTPRLWNSALHSLKIPLISVSMGTMTEVCHRESQYSSQSLTRADTRKASIATHSDRPGSESKLIAVMALNGCIFPKVFGWIITEVLVLKSWGIFIVSHVDDAFVGGCRSGVRVTVWTGYLLVLDTLV